MRGVGMMDSSKIGLSYGAIQTGVRVRCFPGITGREFEYHVVPRAERLDSPAGREVVRRQHEHRESNCGTRSPMFDEGMAGAKESFVPERRFHVRGQQCTNSSSELEAFEDDPMNMERFSMEVEPGSMATADPVSKWMSAGLPDHFRSRKATQQIIR